MKGANATIINKQEPNRCDRCKYLRGEHNYRKRDEAKAAGEAEPCNHFEPTPLRVEYLPPPGDRGNDPARFRTNVIRHVLNSQLQTVEIHTYHEAELRGRDIDHRTGLASIVMVTPRPDPDTGEWRDCDRDRSYLYRYLSYNPSKLRVDNGAWVSIEGFSFADGEDGGSSWSAAGPDNTTKIHMEKWYQVIPEESWKGDEVITNLVKALTDTVEHLREQRLSADAEEGAAALAAYYELHGQPAPEEPDIEPTVYG